MVITMNRWFGFLFALCMITAMVVSPPSQVLILVLISVLGMVVCLGVDSIESRLAQIKEEIKQLSK